MDTGSIPTTPLPSDLNKMIADMAKVNFNIDTDEHTTKLLDMKTYSDFINNITISGNRAFICKTLNRIKNQAESNIRENVKGLTINIDEYKLKLLGRYGDLTRDDINQENEITNYLNIFTAIKNLSIDGSKFDTELNKNNIPKSLKNLTMYSTNFQQNVNDLPDSLKTLKITSDVFDKYLDKLPNQLETLIIKSSLLT